MNPETPAWLAQLDEDDLQFIRRFVLASGSLKELARLYSVSYPTVRARLDRLIAKVKVSEDPEPNDPFERKIRLLVADGSFSAKLGKELVAVHQLSLKRAPMSSQKGTK